MTASQIGFQVGVLATSVVAISLLHATSGQVGMLNGAMTLAFLLIGLPAGAWVDHWRKRRVMIVADLVRVLALLSVPIAWWLEVLTIWQLLVVALIMGFASVFFDVAYQSYVPLIVSTTQIGPANGRMEASYQIARIGGPGLAGWLLGVISAPLAYLITGGTYLSSAWAIWRIKQPEPAPARGGGRIWQEIGEGLAFVRSQPLLGPLFMCIAWAAFTSQAVQVLLPIIALRELDMGPTTLGLLLSIAALGGVAGVALRAPVVNRLGEGPAIYTCYLCGAAAMFGVPLAPLAGPWAAHVLVAANLVSAFFNTIYNVTQLSLRQRLCPPHLLGRLNATFRFAVWGVMPLGAVAAGWCADHLGSAPTLYLFISLSLLAGVGMIFTPTARLKYGPSPWD